MSRYQFAPEAAGDLFEIWSYIARDSIGAANRVEEAIYKAFDSHTLLEYPRASIADLFRRSAAFGGHS